jgi:exosortase
MNKMPCNQRKLHATAIHSAQFAKAGTYEITKVTAAPARIGLETSLQITLEAPACKSSRGTRKSNQRKTFVLKSWSPPLLVVLIAGSLAIWWNALIALFSLALADERYTHILLVLPVSAALIFLDFKSVTKPNDPETLSPVTIPVVFLIFALLANATLRWNVGLSPDIQLGAHILALVVWWIAAFILCFDMRAFRGAAFPLCFLFWMVPPPEFAMNAAVDFLQRGSAIAAHLLFLAFRIPVAQRGMLIHIPGLTMEVAPECSSIRSSLMLLVTTTVLVHILLRSAWKRLLVVAVAIPVSIAKNGLRIFVLGVLATRVDPSFLTGRLHREGGIIYFLLALAGILSLIWILQRGKSADPEFRSAG